MSRQDEKKREVSVIIPVYNAQKYIRQTMDYLLHQTLESIELIFVDNQSTDQSREIIMEYKKQYPQKIIWNMICMKKCLRKQKSRHVI